MSNQSTAAVLTFGHHTPVRIKPQPGRAPRALNNLYLREGVWWWRKTIKGREYRYSTGFAEKDWQLALRKAADIERKIRLGEFETEIKIVPTLTAWTTEYFATWKTGARNARIDAFLAKYGTRRLDQITTDECQAWKEARLHTISTRGEVFAPLTVRTECAQLAAIFEQAVKSKRTKSNPWKGVTLPPLEGRERVLELHEQPLLLAQLTLDAHHRAVRILIGSGLRKKEFLGLEPRDIDVRNQTIHVRRELAKRRKERWVTVCPQVIALLDEQRQVVGLDWRAHARLFAGCEHLTDALRGASERAGLQGATITMHDLRRTYGTRAAEAGMPIKVLQKLMGHSNVQTTLKYYVRSEAKDAALFVAKVDWQLGPVKVGKTA